MDGHELELSSTADLLAEIDGADVAAVVHVHVNVRMALRQRAREWRISRRPQDHGSTAGRHGSKRRDFSASVHNILQGYFGVGGLPPIHDERHFETPFRVARALFRRV